MTRPVRLTGSPPPLARPVRRGLTLVEVLAGLALLGTLLASLLVAHGAQTRQARRAADRRAAAEALDALLHRWHADRERLPPAPAGPLSADGRLAWRAARLRRPGAAALGCVVVRVEAVRAGADAGAATGPAAGPAGPLAVVELLVADEIAGGAP